jgi:hypothetical protein
MSPMVKQESGEHGGPSHSNHSRRSQPTKNRFFGRVQGGSAAPPPGIGAPQTLYRENFQQVQLYPIPISQLSTGLESGIVPNARINNGSNDPGTDVVAGPAPPAPGLSYVQHNPAQAYVGYPPVSVDQPPPG